MRVRQGSKLRGDVTSRKLYMIGGLSALVQLVGVLALILVSVTLGPKPATVEEFFAVQQGRLVALLRGDFLLMLLVAPYLGTFSALYKALKRIDPAVVTLATLCTLIGVTVCFSTESTFALLRLGDKYITATNDVLRAGYVAAGEAVVAADLWHSTGAYMGGILLQGAGVLISLVMLRSKSFSKVTAYAGLIGNALDLFQHMVHPLVPAVSAPVQMIMGPFYLVWFIMLARDFFRLSAVRKVKPVVTAL